MRLVSNWHLVSVAAGIGEEVLFRGASATARDRVDHALGGIAVASMLFGLAHAVTPAYFVAATVIGSLFRLAGLGVCRIWLPLMVAHAVYDFFALLFIQFRAADGQFPAPGKLIGETRWFRQTITSTTRQNLSAPSQFDLMSADVDSRDVLDFLQAGGVMVESSEHKKR